MNDAFYPTPLTHLQPAAPLFDRPTDEMTSRETQFWLDVHIITARALQSTAAVWMPWRPGRSPQDNHELHALKTGPLLLCLTLARDMLPSHNLDADGIFQQVLFVAEAFGLIQPRRGPGPQYIAYRDSPALSECSHVASLALEGQFPAAAIDQWYRLRGGRCPRCGHHALGQRPAITRTGTDRICAACAYDEAMRGPATPRREQWPVTIVHRLPDHARLEQLRLSAIAIQPKTAS